MGTVVPHLICTIWWCPVHVARPEDGCDRLLLIKAYLRPYLCVDCRCVAMGYAFFQLEAASWLVFAAEAMAMCGVFWLASYFVCLDPAQRAMDDRQAWSDFHARRSS